MQTSLLLPLILIAGTGSTPTISDPVISGINTVQSAAHDVAVTQIFEGCRSPVLDTREPSKILFQKRLDAFDEVLRDDFAGVDEAPLFVAQCGEEFVLFTRPTDMRGAERLAAPDGPAAPLGLYVRYERATYSVVQEHWG